jgi:hypothetical protein
VGDTVFANGMSIACKVSSGKTIAAMPDVCLSPPSPPAGPVPIPYPNTAMASDTDQGSKTVQIGGQEIMLKDKSVFKTSSGNEAATKSFGMSVVTHQIQGKASFISWSMNVKFEGENVPRHLDLMGQNEASSPHSPPPHPFTATTGAGSSSSAAIKKKCQKMRADILVKYGKLGAELRKYDPVSDAKGGFLSHVGTITKPGGHYKKIKDYQRGLKNDLTKFRKDCSESGVKVDKKVDSAANQAITKPPGIP